MKKKSIAYVKGLSEPLDVVSDRDDPRSVYITLLYLVVLFLFITLLSAVLSVENPNVKNIVIHPYFMKFLGK